MKPTDWSILEKGIGRRLREARENQGLTQDELAARAETSQGVIQKIENGHSLRPRIVVALALACRVTPVWLAWGVTIPLTTARQALVEDRERIGLANGRRRGKAA